MVNSALIALLAFCLPVGALAQTSGATSADSSRLTIRVRSDSGPLLAGVHLSIVRQVGTARLALSAGITDDGGVALLPWPQHDSVTLEAVRLGYERSRRAIALDSLQSPLEIVLTSVAPKFSSVPVCTTDEKPAIRLYARVDALLDTVTATVRVQDGAFEEVRHVVLPHPVNIDLAYRRSGRFSLEVSVPGYPSFRQDSIDVRRSACGPVTRVLRVSLIRPVKLGAA